MSTLDSINSDLAHVTLMKRMEFNTDMRTGRCSLQLELLADHNLPTARLKLEAHGVTELSTQRWGGGITQLLCLHAKDVSDQQHDRVRFVLEDLENKALSLKCSSLTVARVSVDE